MLDVLYDLLYVQGCDVALGDEGDGMGVVASLSDSALPAIAVDNSCGFYQACILTALPSHSPHFPHGSLTVLTSLSHLSLISGGLRGICIGGRRRDNLVRLAANDDPQLEPLF